MTATLESQGLATVVEIERNHITLTVVTADDQATARRISELEHMVAELRKELDAERKRQDT